MEAKVRFVGGVEEDGDAVVGEGGGESVLLDDEKEADLSLEKDDVLGI